jgi:hypothetical protein
MFGEDRQPDTPYLLVPKVSSENRVYLPIGFVEPEIVASGSALIVPKASLYDMGILSAAMHMAWMRYTCGRLESRYQYSSSLVYNNFPWPNRPSPSAALLPLPASGERDRGEGKVHAIETAAQAVLDARAEFPDASLADLYDPLSMPPALVKAHQKLDAVVDAAYGKKNFRNDAERAAFLFELYQHYAGALAAIPAKKPRKPRA